MSQMKIVLRFKKKELLAVVSRMKIFFKAKTELKSVHDSFHKKCLCMGNTV